MRVVPISFELEAESGDYIGNVFNLKFNVDIFLLIDCDVIDKLGIKLYLQVMVVHNRDVNVLDCILKRRHK